MANINNVKSNVLLTGHYTNGNMLQIVDGTLTIGDGSIVFQNVTTSTKFNINSA